MCTNLTSKLFLYSRPTPFLWFGDKFVQYLTIKHFCTADPCVEGLVVVYCAECNVWTAGVHLWASAAKLQWMLVGPCKQGHNSS